MVALFTRIHLDVLAGANRAVHKFILGYELLREASAGANQPRNLMILRVVKVSLYILEGVPGPVDVFSPFSLLRHA